MSESDVLHLFCHSLVSSGYLVHVGSQQEQNCLLKFGHSQGYKAWYWTDGKSFHKGLKLESRYVYCVILKLMRLTRPGSTYTDLITTRSHGSVPRFCLMRETRLCLVSSLMLTRGPGTSTHRPANKISFAKLRCEM